MTAVPAIDGRRLDSLRALPSVCTEPVLCSVLGLKTSEMASLRAEGRAPLYYPGRGGKRCYKRRDVLAWAATVIAGQRGTA